MTTDKLIRMAGQMADFFRSQPDAPPAEAVAHHINEFWSYGMRRRFVDQIRDGAEADPIVRAAAEFVHIPENAD